MCTWCPAGVMCDLPICEYVSELDMYPCCRCALTVGGVVRVRGPCWSPLFVHILLLLLSLLLVVYFDGSLRSGLPAMGVRIVGCVPTRDTGGRVM